MAAAMAAAIGSTLSAALGAAQQLKTGKEQTFAGTMQSGLGSMVSDLVRGGYSARMGFLAEHSAQKYAGKGALVGKELLNAAGNVGQVIGGTVAVAGSPFTGPATPATAALGAGVAANGARGLVSQGVRVFTGGISAEEQATVMRGIESRLASDPIHQMAGQLLVEEADTYASGNRALMGKAGMARGIGTGFGRRFGDSVAIAHGLQRLTGMSGMEDGRALVRAGRKADPAMHQKMIQEGAAALTQYSLATGNWNTSDQMAAITKNAEEHLQDRKAVYRSTGRGTLRGVMQLAGHGIDLGVATQSVGNIFQGLGGQGRNKMAAGETIMQAFERAVARGTSQGITDPRTREELVSYMGQAAQGRVLSDTSGIERMASLLGLGGEKGKEKTKADIEGTKAAFNALNAAVENPMLQGLYIKQAAEAMGANAPIHALKTAGAATWQELMQGSQALSDSAAIRGLSKEQEERERFSLARQRVIADVKLGARAAGLSENIDQLMQDPKQLRTALSNLKRYHGDEHAVKRAAEVFPELIRSQSFADMTTGARETLKQYGGSATISMEEAAKQQIRAMVDLKKELENQRAAWKEIFEKTGKLGEEARVNENFDINKGTQILVTVDEIVQKSKTQSWLDRSSSKK